jgi:hypothetical protein
VSRPGGISDAPVLRTQEALISDMKGVSSTHSGHRRLDRSPPSERQLSAAIEAGANCPLMPDEITKWETKLRRRADSEVRLQEFVSYWFYIARSFSQIWRTAEQERVRQYVQFRREQGDLPESIALPPHVHRFDKWLPDIASRLSAIHTELLGLPGAVKAELSVRFPDYGDALDHLVALSAMLNTTADAWDRPRPGQPSLELPSHAVGLLACAVEDYTGETFPSPRSIKRQAEIDLVRLLASRLFPSYTPSQIETMLGHFHSERLHKEKGKTPPRPRKQL